MLPVLVLKTDVSLNHESKIWCHCSIRLLHFLFLIFQPVFEHWTGGEATPTNQRQCRLLIHPCNGIKSFARASHLKIICSVRHSRLFTFSTQKWEKFSYKLQLPVENLCSWESWAHSSSRALVQKCIGWWWTKGSIAARREGAMHDERSL